MGTPKAKAIQASTCTARQAHYSLVFVALSFALFNSPALAQSAESASEAPKTPEEILKGQVEQRDDGKSLSSQTGKSDANPLQASTANTVLNSSTQKDSYIDFGPDAQKRASELLHGKVEDRDKADHILRPREGNPLSKSVRVLSGQATMNNGVPLRGAADDDSLDSALKMDNFNLKPMTPKSDWTAERSTTADLQSGRYRGPNYQQGGQQFAWGINGWAINNGWGVGDWGIRGWGINGWAVGNSWNGNNSFSSDWNRRMITQEQLKADLVSQGGNANLNRNNSSGKMRPVPIPPQDWGIQPMSAPAPAYADQNILWDAWYQSVSNALYRNWISAGQQPGEATIRIFVRQPRHIEAQILHSNNQAATFKSNLINAVARLNGSPILDFPSNSQKQAVSFDTVFTADASTASGAYSERKGELELVRIRPALRNK